MKTLTPWFIAAALFGCVTIDTAPAAVDMFLDLGEIGGEATDENDVHEGEIEVLGFSWGATNPGARKGGGSAGRPKANIQDFSFYKSYDAASPDLFIACATGRKIEEAIFTVRYERDPAAAPQRPEDEFLVVTLTDVLVSSITDQAASGSEGTLVEKIVLSFGHIEIQYTPIDPLTGQPGDTIVVGYDVKKNKVDAEDTE